MGRETIENVNPHFSIFGNHKIRKCQVSPFFMILSGKFANYCVISCEIAKIMGIGHEWDITI